MSSLANCVGGGNTGSPGTEQGGNTATGGAGGNTGGSTSGGNTASGGTKASGGSGGSTSGGSSGGSSAGGTGGTKAGGTTVTGGKSTGGVGGTNATGGAGGTGVVGGATGGTSSTGGATSTGGARVDQGGVALAKPGDSATASRAYLNLGEMRIINNRWGADALNCGGASYKIFVGSDKTIGYDFNRPTCGGEKAKPDYPEIEFGVAPFGANSPDLTSPAFSSTTLLPIQIKDLKSATLNVDNFVSTYQKASYYDTNFEFWITKQNPLTSSNPGVYAEVIAFIGWNGNRMSSPDGWPCDKSGSVTAGANTYSLCHQSDTWSNGRWRFFNFNINGGPMNSFSGKVDIKAMLDWVMSKYSGFSSDMWLTRIEVGTEVDDNTQGTAKFSNLTFEINGSSRSIELAN
jgi:hypothetical protein